LALAKDLKLVDWSMLCRRSIIPPKGFANYICQIEVVTVVPRLQQLVDEMEAKPVVGRALSTVHHPMEDEPHLL
jgi:hypothetical protein